MFKCSLSAPAPQHQLSYPAGLPAAANPAGRNHPLRQVTMPMDTPPTPYDGTGHLASHHAYLDDDALKECAMVSHLFLLASRKHLFFSIQSPDSSRTGFGGQEYELVFLDEFFKLHLLNCQDAGTWSFGNGPGTLCTRVCECSCRWTQT
jgi:hypothetical protein